MYGKKTGDQNAHFYLTDIDAEFYREGEDKFMTIEAGLGSVCHDLVDHEKKFTPTVRFEAARTTLLGIVNEMLQEHPEWKMLEEAKGWLEQ